MTLENLAYWVHLDFNFSFLLGGVNFPYYFSKFTYINPFFSLFFYWVHWFKKNLFPGAQSTLGHEQDRSHFQDRQDSHWWSHQEKYRQWLWEVSEQLGRHFFYTNCSSLIFTFCLWCRCSVSWVALFFANLSPHSDSKIRLSVQVNDMCLFQASR